MSTKKVTYLKELLDAEINEEENKSTFIFQNERIGLKNISEIEFIREVDSKINKEIVMTDDELIIKTFIPETYKRFGALQKEDERSRWIFAHQLVEKVTAHPYPRLNIVVCPENIMYDPGMTPYFMHYGVMKSLPPFEEDDTRIWLETKAAVAAAVDGSRTFDEYVNFHETLVLGTSAAEIMSMVDHQSLLGFIKEQLDLLEEKEATYVQLPKKKWKMSKIFLIGLTVLLVPALIFTFYTFIYEKPRNEAYLLSHEHYLAKKYSEVVTILSPHSVKKMPYVVLYELAHSSVINEELTEEQKKNVLNNITLQTDAMYLRYWIYIGRGEAEKAIDLARLMEDGEIITYGLYKRREEIQAEPNLSGEEKEQMLKEIDDEVGEYERLMKENEEAEEDAKADAKADAEAKAKAEAEEETDN